jgi:hypothetical protein
MVIVEAIEATGYTENGGRDMVQQADEVWMGLEHCMGL